MQLHLALKLYSYRIKHAATPGSKVVLHHIKHAATPGFKFKETSTDSTENASIISLKRAMHGLPERAEHLAEERKKTTVSKGLLTSVGT